MKGIILAGGAGARLYPMTAAVCKQLLPVYDKPLIYYPFSTLLSMRIDNILIISTPKDTPEIATILRDGGRYGIKLSYTVQDKPAGIAQAFTIGEEFIGDDACCLILGDNIFHGSNLQGCLYAGRIGVETTNKAWIYGYHVSDPQRYGIVEFGSGGQILGIEEKPLNPRSSYAVVGIYMYPRGVAKETATLTPSARGELEITDLNLRYLKMNRLNCEILPLGTAWLDAGTPQSLLESSEFIATIQNRTGCLVAVPEIVALQEGLLSPEEFEKTAISMPKGPYAECLLRYLQHTRKKEREIE